MFLYCVFVVKLVDEMGKQFRSVMKRYNLAPGDFPDIEDFKAKAVEQDFSKFSGLKQRLLDDLETVLGSDIPRLMEALPRSLNPDAVTAEQTGAQPLIFDAPKAGGGAAEDNPWGDDGDDNPSYEWALQEYVPTYQARFNSAQANGLISGGAAKPILSASGLPSSSLKKIWGLADIDKDGQLDLQEFVVAMFLIDMVKQGSAVPEALDEAMVPPEKRR